MILNIMYLKIIKNFIFHFRKFLIIFITHFQNLFITEHYFSYDFNKLKVILKFIIMAVI